MAQVNSTIDDAAQDEAAEASLLGMEDLDSMSFDDLEAAPGFVTPPEGSYQLILDKATRATRINKKEKKPVREINHIYKILKTYELVDPTEKAPPDGSLCSERWGINAQSLPYWKTRVLGIAGDDVKGADIGTVVAMLNERGYVFDCKVKHRESKGDDGKMYTNWNMTVTQASQRLPEGEGELNKGI